MQIEKLYKDREKSAKKADPKEQLKSKKEDYKSFLAALSILTEEISPKQGQVNAAGGSFASGTSGSKRRNRRMLPPMYNNLNHLQYETSIFRQSPLGIATGVLRVTVY